MPVTEDPFLTAAPPAGEDEIEEVGEEEIEAEHGDAVEDSDEDDDEDEDEEDEDEEDEDEDEDD